MPNICYVFDYHCGDNTCKEYTEKNTLLIKIIILLQNYSEPFVLFSETIAKLLKKKR